MTFSLGPMPTWDLQLVAEGVRPVGTQPGGVLLQVAWLLRGEPHGPHQFFHLLQEPLVLPGLKQPGPLGAQQLLHIFGEFLEHFKEDILASFSLFTLNPNMNACHSICAKFSFLSTCRTMQSFCCCNSYTLDKENNNLAVDVSVYNSQVPSTNLHQTDQPTWMNFFRKVPNPSALAFPSDACISLYKRAIFSLSKLGLSSSFFT